MKEDKNYVKTWLLFFVYLVATYVTWLFPFTGFFGLHWLITLRGPIRSSFFHYHSIVRMFLLVFSHFMFWFTRLFVCDYRWMVAGGFIPWYDNEKCTDGKSHPSGCFNKAVSFFLFVHLFAMFAMFFFWILDGLTLWISELLIVIFKFRERKEEDEGKKEKISTVVVEFILYSILVISTVFCISLFYSWILMFIIARIDTPKGYIQGSISLAISLVCITISYVIFVIFFVLVKIRRRSKVVESSSSDEEVEAEVNVDDEGEKSEKDALVEKEVEQIGEDVLEKVTVNTEDYNSTDNVE